MLVPGEDPLLGRGIDVPSQARLARRMYHEPRAQHAGLDVDDAGEVVHGRPRRLRRAHLRPVLGQVQVVATGHLPATRARSAPASAAASPGTTRCRAPRFGTPLGRVSFVTAYTTCMQHCGHAPTAARVVAACGRRCVARRVGEVVGSLSERYLGGVRSSWRSDPIRCSRTGRGPSVGRGPMESRRTLIG